MNTLIIFTLGLQNIMCRKSSFTCIYSILLSRYQYKSKLLRKWKNINSYAKYSESKMLLKIKHDFTNQFQEMVKLRKRSKFILKRSILLKRHLAVGNDGVALFFTLIFSLNPLNIVQVHQNKRCVKSYSLFSYKSSQSLNRKACQCDQVLKKDLCSLWESRGLTAEV